MIHKVLQTGNHVLAACDYVGESIASFLGITTPKYSYEIEQFKKDQEEHAKAEEEEKQVGGWVEPTTQSNDKPNDATTCITTQETMQKF